VSEGFFSFFTALFFAHTVCGSAGDPSDSACQLVAGLIPLEAERGILAWLQEKFTKNFSNGKKNRLPVARY
jgi:hypothetical protein